MAATSVVFLLPVVIFTFGAQPPAARRHFCAVRHNKNSQEGFNRIYAEAY
jgi:hypothetical protein